MSKRLFFAFVLTLAATTLLSGSIFSSMSFAYGKGTGRVDKNFVRDDNRSIVIDLKNKKSYTAGTAGKTMNYTQAQQYCQNLDFAGHRDWQLPNKEELTSLLELSRRDLSVKHAFRNVQEGIYWSSTKDRHKEAWYVDFDLGRYSTAPYDHRYYVLCVREGA
jgi:hypothetical protein